MPDFDHIDAFDTTVERAAANDHEPGMEVPTMVYVFAAIASEKSGTFREYERRESARRGLTPATW